MENYDYLKQPPQWALKTIQGGRLQGKTDINPQWRYQAMTEVYGPCGEGWTFVVESLWTEPGPDNQVFAFAQVSLFVKSGEDKRWSAAIPGVGGNMLIAKESRGPQANDEGYKMAVTDALGNAMKMLGVAADIYAGLWDGSKYRDIDQSVDNSRNTKSIFEKHKQALQDAQSLDELAIAWDAIGKAAPKKVFTSEQYEQLRDLKEMRKGELGTPPEENAEVAEEDWDSMNQELGSKDTTKEPF